MPKRRTEKIPPPDGPKKGEVDISPEQIGHQAIVRANVNRELRTAPTFVSLYTNDTQLQTTPWDVRLIFGQIVEPPTPERPTVVVNQVGEVRMSPQHAKLVAALLLRQVQNYEETLGPLAIPKE